MATISSSCCPCSYYMSHKARRPTSNYLSLVVNNNALLFNRRRKICCSAVQESSTSTVASEAQEKKEVKKAVASDGNDPTASDSPKPNAAAKAKAVVKPLPQLMEEDVIPSLQTTLEAEQDVSQLQLSFNDNKLEGSFLKKDIPYTFWAFFPDGTINGPKGFSISSYGSYVSTVEPFLVDEKKPTAKHVVFWVQKRLAAQGIIPVWKD